MLASSCVDLWQNGAYHYGPYYIKSPVNEAQSIKVYCNNVPSYDFGYKPITDWKYEGSGGPPTPWTTQYKQNLFSNNTLSFKGVGYQFPPITKGVVISLPHVYLLRERRYAGVAQFLVADEEDTTSWRKYIPMIASIGVVAMMIAFSSSIIFVSKNAMLNIFVLQMIGAYAAFTWHNERKGEKFKTDRIRASLTAEYLEISETPEISTSVKAEANTATKQKPMQKPKMDSFKIEEAKSKQFGTSTSLGDVKLRPSTSFDEKQKLMSHRLTSPALKTTSPAVQTTIPALRTTSSMVQTDFPMEIETQTEVTSTQEETSQIKTENPPKQDFYKESSRETSKVRFHSDSKKSLTKSEELLNFNVDSKLMWDPLDDSTLDDSEKLQSLSQIHKNTIKAKSGSYSAEATSKPKHGKIPDSLDKKESTKEKTDSTDATEKLGETDTPSPRAKDDNEVNNDGKKKKKSRKVQKNK
ncbi:hypothetical protein EB796_004290 [Bugula neritina]|uniref:Uncharacterized protein n=1 Tax=Bugula neritina TaxID=10212 RepID=A0A7J7KGM9_BUGNE|nr:hypothetical protein EB796_004290 [Bugula neritina]